MMLDLAGFDALSSELDLGILTAYVPQRAVVALVSEITCFVEPDGMGTVKRCRPGGTIHEH